jgi:hypothetical protein
MIKQGLLLNELNNWNKFLAWLEKINFKASKEKLNTTQKGDVVIK